MKLTKAFKGLSVAAHQQSLFGEHMSREDMLLTVPAFSTLWNAVKSAVYVGSFANNWDYVSVRDKALLAASSAFWEVVFDVPARGEEVTVRVRKRPTADDVRFTFTTDHLLYSRIVFNILDAANLNPAMSVDELAEVIRIENNLE